MEIDRTVIEYPYGVAQPLRNYTLAWACGCSRPARTAARTIEEGSVQVIGAECPECYKGPYATWDWD